MDQIGRTFNEVRNMGLVRQARSVKRKIGPLHPLLNFRAGSFLSPRAIYYSSRFSDLTENAARFAILHEEGHFRIGQHSNLIHSASKIALSLGALAALLLIASSLAILTGIDIDVKTVSTLMHIILYTVAALAVVIVATMRWKHRNLESDEDNSDDFAADNLKSAFGLRCPSSILKSLLDQLKLGRSTLSSLLSPLIWLAGGDLHRPNQQRIDRIANLFDEPPC